MRNFTINVAKTKALISFAVTAKLICDFAFAYAKHWFSHDAAHMLLNVNGHMETGPWFTMNPRSELLD